jgi:hemoglobin-like flavoprotein
MSFQLLPADPPAASLTKRQIELVQRSFRKLAPIEKTFGELFFTRLFALDPDFETILRKEVGAPSPEDWQTHGSNLLGVIDVIGTMVSNLQHIDKLAPAVATVGRVHFGNALALADFDLVGQALLWTLARGLEDDFTDEAKLAWLDAYSLLAASLAHSARPTIDFPAAA